MSMMKIKPRIRKALLLVLLLVLSISAVRILSPYRHFVYSVNTSKLFGEISPDIRSVQVLNLVTLPTGNAGVVQSSDAHVTSISDPPFCPEDLRIKENKVALNLSSVSYEALLQTLTGVLQNGGRYSPRTCKAREHVALIIPYRDREKNLHALLNNLVPFLVRQQLEFTVFVVEQTKDYLFNRCLMFNVGFVEAQKRGNFTCFILHDTDLIPRDNRNLYRCGDSPIHFVTSRSNEKWEEKLPYPTFIGGVLGLRKEHIEKINGCSNYYYGWGLEDDDLQIRLEYNSLLVERPAMDIGAYYSLHHEKQTENPQRSTLHRTIHDRRKNEGLSTLHYALVDAREKPLYTWLLVKPPPPPPSIYNSTAS